jgi:hypothetical protein
MNVKEIGWEGTDWIDLAQDRDQWRALVNTAMNLWVGAAWVEEQLSTSQEGLCSI